MNTAIRTLSWMALYCCGGGMAMAQQATAPSTDATAPAPAPTVTPAPAPTVTPAPATKRPKQTAQSEAGDPRAAAPAAPGPPAQAAAAARPPAAGRPGSAVTGPKAGATDRLSLGTATVTGSQEQPKVMYIVPWKRSDIGDMAGKPMNSLVDEILAPVDRDVFKREVVYYRAVQADASQNGAQVRPSQQGEK